MNGFLVLEITRPVCEAGNGTIYLDRKLFYAPHYSINLHVSFYGLLVIRHRTVVDLDYTEPFLDFGGHHD